MLQYSCTDTSFDTSRDYKTVDVHVLTQSAKRTGGTYLNGVAQHLVQGSTALAELRERIKQKQISQHSTWAVCF